MTVHSATRSLSPLTSPLGYRDTTADNHCDNNDTRDDNDNIDDYDDNDDDDDDDVDDDAKANNSHT